MDVSNLQEYFADIKDGWPLIAGSALVALVISITFSIFLNYCAGCFVWVTIVCCWVFLGCLGTAAFLVDRVEFIQKILNYNTLPDNMKNRDYQLACAYICWSLCALSLLIICCTLKQIRICTYPITCSHRHHQGGRRLHHPALLSLPDPGLYHHPAAGVPGTVGGDPAVRVLLGAGGHLASLKHALWLG